MAKATKTLPKSVQQPQQPSTTGTPKKAANAKNDAGDSAGSSSVVSVSKQNSPSKGKKMNVIHLLSSLLIVERAKIPVQRKAVCIA